MVYQHIGNSVVNDMPVCGILNRNGLQNGIPFVLF